MPFPATKLASRPAAPSEAASAVPVESEIQTPPRSKQHRSQGSQQGMGVASSATEIHGELQDVGEEHRDVPPGY